MKQLHRGWLILGITALTLFACLGLGRFALGAMIPFMKEGLVLSYSETGWVVSAVFVGYLIMVTVAGHLVLRYTAKRVIVISLFVITLGMVGNANASGFWSAYLSCLLVGLGAGGANIPALGLLSRWFAAHKRGMAMGIAYSGTGIGFVFSGLTIPTMVNIDPVNGWRHSWLILALFIFFLAIIHQIWLKSSPQEVGLEPIGSEQMHQSNLSSSSTFLGQSVSIYQNKTLWLLGSIYFTWGFSYIIFSTFLVDYLIQDIGVESSKAGQYFSLVGLCSIISGFIWGSISDRLGRALTLSIMYIVQSLMLMALAISVHSIFLLGAMIIFALTLWAVPTIMAAKVGDLINPNQVSAAMGFITLLFGVGQFISPIINGYLLELYHQYAFTFIFSAIICFIGGLGSIFLHLHQKKHAQQLDINL